MGKYVSPEYQEQLDRLADKICQPKEYEQSLEDFDRVFCPGVPEDFFKEVLERTDIANEHFQQRFEERL